MIMTYYEQHRDERLVYQKHYIIVNNDKYKAYQKEYREKNKEHINQMAMKRKQRKKIDTHIDKPYKPLKQYQLEKLESMLRRKLKDYRHTLQSINEAYNILDNSDYDTTNVIPLTGIKVQNSKFVLEFD